MNFDDDDDDDDDESISVSCARTLVLLFCTHSQPDLLLLCVCVCVCSIQSSDTLRPEQDTGSKDREVRLESEVTAETDDATVTSPVPTMPLLTHQGKE